jgi:hypothetical protein
MTWKRVRKPREKTSPPGRLDDWARKFVAEQEPHWYDAKRPWAISSGHRPRAVLRSDEDETVWLTTGERRTLLEVTLSRSRATAARFLLAQGALPGALAQHDRILEARTDVSGVAPGPRGRRRPATTTAYLIWREAPERPLEVPELSAAERSWLEAVGRQLEAEARPLGPMVRRGARLYYPEPLPEVPRTAPRLAGVARAVAWLRSRGLLLTGLGPGSLGQLVRRGEARLSLANVGGGVLCPSVGEVPLPVEAFPVPARWLAELPELSGEPVWEAE